MHDKILVIIGTAEPRKAEAGVMYAVNTLKYGWMSDVKLVFFGPAETLLLNDPDLQELVRDFHSHDRTAVACRFLSDRDGTSEEIAALGVEVAYVGEMISGFIRDGYVPMVW